MLFELETPRQYNLLASVHSWIYPDIQPVPETTGATFFARMYEINDQLVPIIIEQARPGSTVHVKYPSKEVPVESVKAKLSEVLGLTVKMTGALRAIRRSPQLCRIASQVSGIRPYLSASVYEGLIKTIIQQQISYRAANALTRRMVLELSRKRLFEGLTLYSFPTPAEILSLGLEGLRSLGLGYKSEYVHRIVELLHDGTLSLEELKGKSHDEVRATLVPLRGIGPWTVRTLSIAGLGDYTVFPIDDFGVRNLMGRLYSKNRKRMTTNQVEDIALAWGNDWPLVMYLLMCADVLGYFGEEGRQQTHKRASRDDAKRKSG
ncbi:MAG: hypothetical protein C4K48_07335 [Candidatus Thorarchaeota archaeon]|nr:MAG: hypothetical protein C4K48_07335 [Candidatus Thorarchaeota archaeon]